LGREDRSSKRTHCYFSETEPFWLIGGKRFMSQFNFERWTPTLQSILRMVTGFLFMEHGLQKIFGLLGAPEQPPLASQAGVGGMLELVGGGLFLLGLFTRPVAFILSGMMAVAYFQFHAPHGFWPIVNKGEPAALYCFVFLFFAAAGAGPISLDAMLKRKR